MLMAFQSGITLGGVWGPYGCQGLNPGLPYGRQIPTMAQFLSFFKQSKNEFKWTTS